MKKRLSLIRSLVVLFFTCAIVACSSNDKDAVKYDYFTNYDQYFGFVPDDIRVIKTNVAHSGYFVSKMDTVFPYSLGLVRNWVELTDKHIQEISVDYWVYVTAVNQPVYMVCSFEYPGNPTPWYYQFYDMTKDLKQANTWQQMNTVFYLPDTIDKSSLFKLVLWNQAKTPAYVDDLAIQLVEKKK